MPPDIRQTGGNPEKPSEWNIVFSFRTAFLPIAAVMLLVPLAGAACASAEDPAEPEPTAQLLVGTPPPVVATPVDDAAFEGGQEQDGTPAQVSLDWLGQPVEVPPLPAFAVSSGNSNVYGIIDNRR